MAVSKPRRETYHHGRLRQAMVEAATQLIAEVGPHAVTVREAARRAGVSPGAPFRHFPNRAALMTAVAEEAMRRFQQAIGACLAQAARLGPREKLEVIGKAYVGWAVAHPAYFKALSNRDLIDFEGSSVLMGMSAQTEALLAGLLGEARALGLLRGDDVAGAALGARAMVYGLARMYVDGHFIGLTREAVIARMEATLDDYLTGLFKAG
jgi:AcrR family transcriptional regulator